MGREIGKLHPELQVIVEILKQKCALEGLPLLITETFRTVQEQNDLYAKGRTKPGNIVTYVKGTDYQSSHQWGVAFDIAKNIRGQEYSDIAFFERVAVLAKPSGLTWGGDWRSFVDRPHFELTKYMPNASTATLKKQYGSPENFMNTWNDVPQKASSPQSSSSQLDTVVEDTVNELKWRGIIVDPGLWLRRGKEDGDVYHLFRKYYPYIIKNGGSVKKSVKTVNEALAVFQRPHVSIVSEADKWRRKAEEDINIGFLLRALADYIN